MPSQCCASLRSLIESQFCVWYIFLHLDVSWILLNTGIGFNGMASRPVCVCVFILRIDPFSVGGKPRPLNRYIGLNLNSQTTLAFEFLQIVPCCTVCIVFRMSVLLNPSTKQYLHSCVCTTGLGQLSRQVEYEG